MTGEQMATYKALAAHAGSCYGCRQAALPYGLAVAKLCPDGVELADRHTRALALSYRPAVVSTPTGQDEARAAITALGVAMDDDLDVYNDDLGALPELWKFAHRLAAAQARRHAQHIRAGVQATPMTIGAREMLRHHAECLDVFASAMDKEAER